MQNLSVQSFAVQPSWSSQANSLSLRILALQGALLRRFLGVVSAGAFRGRASLRGAYMLQRNSGFPALRQDHPCQLSAPVHLDLARFATASGGRCLGMAACLPSREPIGTQHGAIGQRLRSRPTTATFKGGDSIAYAGERHRPGRRHGTGLAAHLVGDAASRHAHASVHAAHHAARAASCSCRRSARRPTTCSCGSTSRRSTTAARRTR